MGDRKLFFPLLLFGIFFFLIAVTGFFQITIIKKNIEGLLKGEGETLFKSVAREIEMNMEYLSFLEKSPSIITPNLLNVMAYDEAIIDDLYSQLTKKELPKDDDIPAGKFVIMDKNGNQIMRKGSLKVGSSYVKSLLNNDRQTVIRMPSQDDHTLFMGIKTTERLIFFSLNREELEGLRKKYIMKTILDSEEKRLGVVEINVYDGSGSLYLGSEKRPKDVFTIMKPLNSRYFPKYSMEILVSKQLATDTFKRTTVSFVMLLLFLALGGAAGIYIIFHLHRKHGEKVSEMEKSMAMKERLVSLGRLASGMAHEIRNPLNAMSMSIQRLKREFVPEQAKTEEYYGFLDIVRGELLRVNKIVDEFLLSTKSNAAMEQQRLHRIVAEVTTMLGEKARARGISIVNESDEGVMLDCQQERLKQVFYNIIMNSIEAMTDGGSIRITSESENNHLKVVIKDTGPGIRKDHLLRIFEYYYTTKDKGMGLGLPISYMIVKDHGGDIQVRSEEGKGSVFTITLPLQA
jgi:signal transduction histidine kinase